MEFLVNIDVPHLDPAIRFYTEALGLKLQRRLFEGTVAELTGGPSAVYLIGRAEGTAPTDRSPSGRIYARHWTPVHLDFVVEDIDAAIVRAVAAGATLESGPASLAWGRLATFGDPFGHGFCLVQWIGRGYEEVS